MKKTGVWQVLRSACVGGWLTAGLWDCVEDKFHPNKGGEDFVSPGGTVDITQSNIGIFRTLSDRVKYRFVENVTFTANAGESAMTVADGANVILEIPSGVTVNLTGGDANGTTGAGAGIEVPSDATLTITGMGTLNATGGDAANGVQNLRAVCGDRKFVRIGYRQIAHVSAHIISNAGDILSPVMI